MRPFQPRQSLVTGRSAIPLPGPGQRSRFVRVHVVAGRVVADAALGSETAAHLTRWVLDRDKAVRELAPLSGDSGLNTGRVDAWLSAKGLTPPPAVVMGLSEARAYRQALAAAGHQIGLLDKMADWDGRHIAGVHVREAGLVLSYRAHGMDEWTQAHLVHEKAHGCELPREFTARVTAGGGWELQLPRSGYNVRPPGGPETGAWVEEGWAAMLSAEYARDVLHGAGLWPAGRTLPADLAALPAGHAWESPDGPAPVCSITAFAGAGLEMLVTARPDLYDALVRARAQPAGLRDTARIINSVQPGLYQRLRRHEYSDEGLRAGLDDVRAALPRVFTVRLGPSATDPP